MKTVRKIVSKICNEGCIAPFECSRKKWQRNPEGRLLDRFGKGTECPLMQFQAEEDHDKRSFWEKLKDGSYDPESELTEQDTWKVCRDCSHSETDARGFVSNEKAFSDYCMDCPILFTRERIQETLAEAYMS